MRFASLCGLRNLLILSSLLGTGIAQTLTPVVVFPGWPGTNLLVTVQDQSAVPGCPPTGTFEYISF